MESAILTPKAAVALPVKHPLHGMIQEALRTPAFASLWIDGADKTFRPYAMAAMSIGNLKQRLPEERATLYERLATGKRKDMLTELSGRTVSAGFARLLGKTEWCRFTKTDWPRLIDAAADPTIRKALGHLPRISTTLVRQLDAIPATLLLPRVLGILNTVAVSPAQWRRLHDFLGRAEGDGWTKLTAAAHRIDSIGAFWDFFHECVEERWRPWRIPAAAFESHLLEPITGPDAMAAEGLVMRNCLGRLVIAAAKRRNIYFRHRGGTPVTSELVRKPTGWTPGRILGPENAPVDEPLADNILRELGRIAASIPNDGDDMSEAEDRFITELAAFGREKFSSDEIADLADHLRDIRGRTLDDTNGAYAIFAAPSQGYVQFMSNPDGTEYLCEVASHKYWQRGEHFQTAQAVDLIDKAGFLWPYGKANFRRWFPVESRADCDGLAAMALAILYVMFRLRPGQGLDVDVNLPPKKRPSPGNTPLVTDGDDDTNDETDEDGQVHGNHWGCVLEDIESLPDHLLPQIVEQGHVIDDRKPGPLAEGEAIGITWPETPLRFLSLIGGISDGAGDSANALVSAYPYANRGVKHRLIIEEILPWSNGLEGCLRVTFRNDAGPSLTFFDTRFYANRGRYRVGMEADVVLAGLAYRAEVAHPKPVFIEKLETIRAMRAGTEHEGDDSPIEVRLDGAAILMPRDGAGPDDHEFQAPVKDIETFALDGRRITRLTVTALRLSDLDDEDVDLELYVDEERWGSNERPLPGADVQGLLWLQGYLAE